MSKPEARCLAVVRVRGSVNLRKEVKDTLRMLHLSRVNHATLIPSTPPYLGMLQAVKDQVAWGEVTAETSLLLLGKRGEVVGGRKLTDAYLKERGYGTISEVAEALHTLKMGLKDLRDVKPSFRLHPPSGGFKRSLKRSFSNGGETGYRGEKINELIKKMV